MNSSIVERSPRIGDILVSTYGFDACIASWAKVVSVTDKSVKIVRLRDKRLEKHCMEWTSVPDLTGSGVVEVRRFSPLGNSYKVKDNEYSTFHVWDGAPVNCYNYH